VRKAASGGSAAKETNMASFTQLYWFKRLLVLGAVVVCATASVAGASASGVGSVAAPDVFERYAAAHPYGSAAIPDVFERYASAHPYGAAVVPDVVERYAAGHPDGTGATSAALGTERIVDDWFRDPTPMVTPAGDRIVDDSFRDAPTVVTAPKSGNGLDWGAFGIGAGAMLGLTMLVTGLGLGTLAMRHRASKLGTS
jgi:hypothetical protein